jgi:hypothetical protein
MLAMGPIHSDPEVNVNTRQLAQLDSAPEEKYGLSDAARKQIFVEAVKAERRANADAERKYPLPDPLKPDYSQAAAQKQALAQADLSTALLEKYKGEVAETHGLTSDQLDEIIMEGFTKDWPSPPRE